MTARPPRDVRADATRAFERRLRHEGCRVPDFLARELVVLLDSHRIGLTDLTPPNDPNQDYHRPDSGRIAPPPTTETPTSGLAEYLAAKAARPTAPQHRGKTTDTQEGQQ